MRNKSRNWTDVQLIISSISIAFTLGFWSLLASRGKAVVGVSGDASMPLAPDAATSSPSALAPGQVMLLGAQAPQTPSPAVAQPQPAHRRNGGGGGAGGGGGGGGAVASTKSS